MPFGPQEWRLDTRLFTSTLSGRREFSSPLDQCSQGCPDYIDLVISSTLVMVALVTSWLAAPSWLLCNLNKLAIKYSVTFTVRVLFCVANCKPCHCQLQGVSGIRVTIYYLVLVAEVNSHVNEHHLPPGGSCSCNINVEYNKMFKHEVWCISLCSSTPLVGSWQWIPTLNPNCGPVHELPPMNNCCHPLQMKAACCWVLGSWVD